MCNSTDLIVGYLYDELTETERRSFDAHLSVCDECRQEVAGLKATRDHLSLWAPPQPEFAFRIVRDHAPAAKVLPMRSRWKPALGLAAAAVLVLAVASAIANLEVKYDANGLVVRTGWARSDGDTAQNGGSSRPNFAIQPSSTEFQALDRRLRDLEAAAASPTSAGGLQTASVRMDDAEILRRVRQIVTEAESRQQTVVAQQLLQVVRDFDRQRERDLAAIQQGLGTYQGLTNAEIAQQRDMLNQLYRVAARQEK